jgi:protein-S-isoprenylcysteine O-methyltransferase Ste14
MVISIVAAVVQTAWLAVEWRGGFITVEKPWQRARPDMAEGNRDRHSSTIWDAAQGLELLGLVLGFLGMTRIETHGQLVGLVGLALLLLGIAIRWAAIRTLGELFTGVVTIQRDHELVRHGLYRHVRHPSYAGAIAAHLGLGLAFVSWVSLALSTLPIFVAAAYRIRVEEQALREAFGDEYVTYAAGTWRLIRFVY